jgi:hypothetical protein
MHEKPTMPTAIKTMVTVSGYLSACDINTSSTNPESMGYNLQEGAYLALNS